MIGSGVVSASIRDGERLIEAGRMGPGEVLGIEGLIDEEESLAEFRTLTGCLLYRIDKEQVRNCLAQRGGTDRSDQTAAFPSSEPGVLADAETARGEERRLPQLAAQVMRPGAFRG